MVLSTARMGRSTAGFSLLELMISLGIMLAALLSTAPFAKGWNDQNQITKASGVLKQGYGKARALALRNGVQAISTSASSTMCLANSTLGPMLYVHPGVPTSCGSSSGTTAFIWSASWPGGASTTLSAGAALGSFSCFAFGPNGAQTTGSIGTSACQTGSGVVISRGGISSGTFSVIQ